MTSGYWQVGMDTATKQKAAFVTTRGLYGMWCYLAWVSNAPGSFERLTLHWYWIRYYWPGLTSQTYRWVTQCHDFGAKKSTALKRRAALKHYFLGALLEKIAVDILGRLALTPRGKRHVLDVVTDYFTKWTESYAIPDQRVPLMLLRRLLLSLSVVSVFPDNSITPYYIILLPPEYSGIFYAANLTNFASHQLCLSRWSRKILFSQFSLTRYWVLRLPSLILALLCKANCWF